MIIRKKDNSLILDAPITKKSKVVFQHMISNHVFLSFNYPTYLDIPKGSYIEYNGQRFYCIRTQYPAELKSENGYLYELYFDAVEFWFKTRRFYYGGQGYKEFNFNYTGEIGLFAQIVIDNANERFADTWAFNIESGVATRQESITFKGKTIFDSLTEIATAFEAEWWVTTAGTTHTIHFGNLLIDPIVNVNQGEIVKEFPARKADDTDYGTRFFIFGSTEGLPESYGLGQSEINSLTEMRLRLPSVNQYIDAWPNLAPEDVVEQIVLFDAIKPKHNYTITGVTTDAVDIVEFQHACDLYYIVQVSDLLFDNYSGLYPDLAITFDSGSLNGLTFRLASVSNWNANKMKLIPVLQEDGVTIIPNLDLHPHVGDKFTVTGIDIPQSRIDAAEAELLTEGQAYVNKVILETELFECGTNPVYCKKNNINLQPGRKVVLHHERFGTGLSTRVFGFEKLLYDSYQAVYSFGVTKPFSRTKILTEKIDFLNREVVKNDLTLKKGTKTQNNRLSFLRSDLGFKANALDVEASLVTKANAVDVYTIEEVDYNLGLKANSSTTYTKTQVDGSLALKANVADVNSTYALKGGDIAQDFAVKNLILAAGGSIDRYNQTELNIGDTFINLGTAVAASIDGGIRMYGASNALLSTLKYQVSDSRWKLDKGFDITGSLTASSNITSSGAITASGIVTALGGSSTNWNSAYGWGNHALAGYYVGTNATIRALFSSTATGLTYTNTTGVFSLTSGYSIPTTAKQTQWDSAYVHSQLTTGNPHNLDLADIGESYASINYWTLAGENIYRAGGNVGIGNVNPSERFHLTGNLRIENNRQYVNYSIGTQTTAYTYFVILLHEIYDGTLIADNYCKGTFVFERGSSTAGFRSHTLVVDSKSAYNSTYVSSESTSYNGNSALFTCYYNGVKYLAVKVPYVASNFNGGIVFNGFWKSSTLTKPLLIEYYNANTLTVLNAEINDSLTDFVPNNRIYVNADNYNVFGKLGINKTASTGLIDIYSITDTEKLLNFDIERNWFFKKDGAGSATSLTLQAGYDGKTFLIKNSTDTPIVRFFGSSSGNNSTFTGKVGIGDNITTITHNLEVESDSNTFITAHCTNSANAGVINIGTDYGLQAMYMIGYGSTHATQANQMSFKNLTGGDFTWYGSVERMRLTNAGNFGLGTANPTSFAHFYKSTNAGVVVKAENAINGTASFCSYSIIVGASGSQQEFNLYAFSNSYNTSSFRQGRHEIYSNAANGLQLVSANGIRLQNTFGNDAVYIYGNNVNIGETIQNPTFQSGWTGSGWQVTKQGIAEFSDMTIRGSLSVYELIIQQIRATNGAIVVSNANGKVASITTATVGSEVLVFEDPENRNLSLFVANDIVLVQRVNVDSPTSFVKRVVRRVASVSGKTVTFTKDGDMPADTSTFEVGDEVVQIGNSTVAARQGIIYITASDSGAPYQDICSGINSWTAWLGSAKLKVRLGKLDGITDTTAGLPGSGGTTSLGTVQTNYYGLYATNVHLKGHIYALAGNIGEWVITSTSISKNNIELNASTGYIKTGTLVSSDPNVTNIGFYTDNAGSTLIKAGTLVNKDYLRFSGGVMTIDSSAFTLRGSTTLYVDTSKIALGATASTLSVAGTSAGTVIDNAGGFLSYGDANNYIRRSGAALDIKAATFNLVATTGSAIKLGTTPTATSTSKGIYIDSAGLFNAAVDANNYLRLTSSSIDIKATLFTLAATTGSSIKLGATAPTATSTTAGVYIDSAGLFNAAVNATNYIRLTASGVDIKSSNFSLLASTAGTIGLGATSYSAGNGVWLSSTATSRFRIGNAGASRMQWDDTNLEFYNAANQKLVSLGTTNNIAGWEITETKLSKNNTSAILTLGASPDGGAVQGLFVRSDDDFYQIEVACDDTGRVYIQAIEDATVQFSLGSLGNKIAGWKFNNTYLYNSTAPVTTNAFASNPGEMTIGNGAIRAYKFRVDTDGNVYAKDAEFDNCLVKGRFVNPFTEISQSTAYTYTLTPSASSLRFTYNGGTSAANVNIQVDYNNRPLDGQTFIFAADYQARNLYSATGTGYVNVRAIGWTYSTADITSSNPFVINAIQGPTRGCEIGQEANPQKNRMCVEFIYVRNRTRGGTNLDGGYDYLIQK